MVSRESPWGAGKRACGDAGCHIDHSASVLSRLYDLVGSDTCDVVFCCTSALSTHERCTEHRGSGSSAEGSDSRRRQERPQVGGATEGCAVGAAPVEEGGRESAQRVEEPAYDRSSTSCAPSSSADKIPSSASNRRSCNTGKEFRCHRVLFASCSEYFRALLYGGMSESETRRVELRDVAPEGFEAIMTYVYTGRVRLDAGERERREGGRERSDCLNE